MYHVACGILVPRPRIEPVPPAAEAQSLYHWTAREVPVSHLFLIELKLIYNILLVSGVQHSDSVFLYIILHLKLL